MELPDRREKLVNEVDKEKNLEKLANSMKRDTPFGNVEWKSITPKKMKLESTMRSRRPKNVPDIFNSAPSNMTFLDRLIEEDCHYHCMETGISPCSGGDPCPCGAPDCICGCTVCVENPCPSGPTSPCGCGGTNCPCSYCPKQEVIRVPADPHLVLVVHIAVALRRSARMVVIHAIIREAVIQLLDLTVIRIVLTVAAIVGAVGLNYA